MILADPAEFAASLRGGAAEFELREVGAVEVKGFARPVEVFEVIGPATEVEEP